MGEKPKHTRRENTAVIDAMAIADEAISKLERINEDDPFRKKAFDRVLDWINAHKVEM